MQGGGEVVEPGSQNLEAVCDLEECADRRDLSDETYHRGILGEDGADLKAGGVDEHAEERHDADAEDEADVRGDARAARLLRAEEVAHAHRGGGGDPKGETEKKN